MPSGIRTLYSSQMGVPGGAGVINRSFTQPWPTPPGLVVARIYTRVPGPGGTVAAHHVAVLLPFKVGQLVEPDEVERFALIIGPVLVYCIEPK